MPEILKSWKNWIIAILLILLLISFLRRIILTNKIEKLELKTKSLSQSKKKLEEKTRTLKQSKRSLEEKTRTLKQSKRSLEERKSQLLRQVDKLQTKLEDWDNGLLYIADGHIDFHGNKRATISKVRLMNFGDERAYNTKITCKIWLGKTKFAAIGKKTVVYGQVSSHSSEEFSIDLDVESVPGFLGYNWDCWVKSCINCKILANLLKHYD